MDFINANTNSKLLFLLLSNYKNLTFFTDVTDYPHFELPFMVCDNDYRAKNF